MKTFRLLLCVVGIAAMATSIADAQETFRDATAITHFQRALDGYAFQHRQIQRRLGEGADQAAIAAAMRAARPSADGDFFTPMVGDAFRRRIANRMRTPGCDVVAAVQGSEVPRVGVAALSWQAVPGCLLAVLPRLPEELEYRVASVALILVDTHANLVVDVLHGAFPASVDRKDATFPQEPRQ